MADWNNPTLTTNYTDFLNNLKDRDADAAKMFDGVGTNLPVNTIRWGSSSAMFEKFDGTTWNPLASQYDINVTKLEGHNAAYFAKANGDKALDFNAKSISAWNDVDTKLHIEHSPGADNRTIQSLDMAQAVDTVADMEALIVDAANKSRYDGMTCIVRDLDRGGTFIYDSMKESEDNQGTNFNGWIRQYDGAVNVKWFGAKDIAEAGNENFDSTNAIQAAVNSNNIIFIPMGTYLLSSKITLPAILSSQTTRNYTVSIIGENREVSVLKPTHSDYTLEGTSVDGFEVKNIQINTTSAGGFNFTSHCGGHKYTNFFMNGCGAGLWGIKYDDDNYPLQIDNCRFWRHDGYFGGAIKAVDSISVSITNNFISQQRKDGPSLYFTNVKELTIKNNQIECGLSSDGSGSTNATSCLIDGNSFNIDYSSNWHEGPFNYGLSIDGTLRTGKIENCRFWSYNNQDQICINPLSSNIFDVYVSNLVYNSDSTITPTTPIVGNKTVFSRVCGIENISADSSQQTKDKGITEAKVINSVKQNIQLPSSTSPSGQIALTEQGSYIAEIAVVQNDNNHAVIKTFVINYDDYTNDFADAVQLSSQAKGNNVQDFTVSVSNAGIVTVDATLQQAAISVLKSFFIKMISL